MWAEKKLKKRTDSNLWIQQTFDKAKDPQIENRNIIKGKNGINNKKADWELYERNDIDDFHAVKNIRTNTNLKWAGIFYDMWSIWQRHGWIGHSFN
jgi:hypothetical protein